MKEIRFFKVSTLRASTDGKRISGYAAVFNQLSEDLGGFREMVLPGAFDRCLRGAPDVRCLFNHDTNLVLGRTKAGTLRLSADRNGLRFDCDLPDTQAGRDVRESIRRGDIDQCSFGFVVQGQNWREEKGTDGKTQSIRELTDVDLFDVSPVTYAAYPQTSVSARQLWPEGEPAEVRSHKKADGPRVPKPRSPGVPTARTSAPAQHLSLSGRFTLLDQIRKKLGEPASKTISEGRKMRQMSGIEQTEFRHFLKTGEFERRDLNTGGEGADFVPESFNAMVFDALKTYDALFNDTVCTHVESDKGGPLRLFAIDDSESAATIVGESTADDEQDPGLGRIELDQAPTWDTGTVKVSWPMLQDAGVDVASMLAKAFAVRFGRGIGPALITMLLSAAKLGATATGDHNSGSPSGSGQIGYQDLLALRKSVNPAYRAAGAWWLLNDNTLTAIDGLLDANGRPLIHPQYDADGNRILLGYPLGICPSLPDIGAGAKPILFGATGYFVVRTVKGEGRLLRLGERYAEYMQTGFKSFMRANAALLCAAGSDAPVKFLQNAS